MSWNVEGLKETAKYDSVLRFCSSNKISLLCAQETKVESSHTFVKNGWEILMSGLPSSKHHGVGFFVSPALRSHVKDFKPHSPRICEITLATLPHPITIPNIYAPSTVETPETDRQQKSQFWTDLEDLMLNLPNPSHVILVGDCNSRVDANIDPTYTQVGPNVIGRRQTIPEPERDNAVHLLDFLEAHGCYFPQTFSDIPHRKRVTYKEMTCADHSLCTEDVHQWTALDYLIVPQSLRQTVMFTGSIFQQFINTRHLPLVFTAQTQHLQKPPAARRNRYDYTQLSTFYNQTEASLLAMTNNEFPPSNPTGPRILAYTDGSCPNNQIVSFDNPFRVGFYPYPVTTPPHRCNLVRGLWASQNQPYRHRSPPSEL